VICSTICWKTGTPVAWLSRIGCTDRSYLLS
jgi:hypothetical protein